MMPYKLYKNIIVNVFALLGVLTLVEQYGAGFVAFLGIPSISLVIYFASRCLIIFLFFFSIYAFRAKVEGTHKLESPIIFILIGTIFVISLVLYPISYYYLLPEIKNAPDNSSVAQSMNYNHLPAVRFSIARRYYLQTGQTISYLNDKNIESLYSPDDEARKLRGKEKENQQQLNAVRITAKPISIGLSVLFGISSLIFLAFLRYKFKREKVSR